MLRPGKADGEALENRILTVRDSIHLNQKLMATPRIRTGELSKGALVDTLVRNDLAFDDIFAVGGNRKAVAAARQLIGEAAECRCAMIFGFVICQGRAREEREHRIVPMQIAMGSGRPSFSA